MQTTIIEKRFFFILLLINFILAFFVFRSFLIVLILALSFAMILYPFFKWLKRRKFAGWLAALVSVLVFLIVICGPIYAIGNIVLNQSLDAYNSLAKYGSITPFTESINASINKILPGNLSFDINEKIADLAALISKNILGIFSTTLTTIFSFFLMLLAIFYFLKDGKEWKEALIELSPLKNSDDLKIINSFYRTVNGVIKGYLLIALIQGTLMAIGLKIFGVPNPALWGVITGLASMIPTVGTGFVSVPAIIYLYFTGSIGPMIGMIIWAVLIVGLVDNLLNPIIVSKNIKIPMLLILFSVLGGIALLGPVGILIGPLVISLLYTLLSIYRKEFENN
jgi:predicted PurR-regulated permease PerM